jgi:hypothetical protein
VGAAAIGAGAVEPFTATAGARRVAGARGEAGFRGARAGFDTAGVVGVAGDFSAGIAGDSGEGLLFRVDLVGLSAGVVVFCFFFSADI